MYRVRFIILLGLLSNFCFAQHLKGRVLDNLKQPLPGTTVYYDGTTVSTLTNDSGEFILAYNIKLNRPLVFSYMGFQTVFVKDYNTNFELEVILTPAVTTLNEVVVKKDKFPRNEAIRIFKERFLGTTLYGSKSTIENEDDIEFVYNEQELLLKASSEAPLIILNPFLGYKITYELADFEARFSKFSVNQPIVIQSYYAGLSRYDITNENPEIIQNRVIAYKGSSAHFFRSLVNEIWNKDNFQLLKNGRLINPLECFTITVEEDRYKVEIKKQNKVPDLYKNAIAVFDVLYNNKWKSFVKFDTAIIYLDAFGNNLNSKEVSFSGFIGSKRIGDSLPFDYDIE